MKQANKILSEMLGYYKYRVDNNLCTMEEMDNARKAIESNMDIYGSIKDFSNFFDVPENQIRATISRKLLAKPKRILLYPFHKFIEVIPDKWKPKDR